MVVEKECSGFVCGGGGVVMGLGAFVDGLFAAVDGRLVLMVRCMTVDWESHARRGVL